MSHIIGSPFGNGLPYSSLFSVPNRQTSNRFKASKPSEYFWEKATQSKDLSDPNLDSNRIDNDSDSNWLDEAVPALSQEDVDTVPKSSSAALADRKKRASLFKPNSKKRFSRLRQIAFRAFIPKDGKSKKKGNVVTTELVSATTVTKHGKDNSNLLGGPDETNKRFTIFNSIRFKYSGAATQMKSMVAVVRHRISSKSPPDQQPKTWEDYHRMYAEEKIDVLDPPLPPIEEAPAGENPTPYHSRFYMPPRPADEPVRQLVVNRLGIYGNQAFDPSEEGTAKAKARAEAGDILEQKGEAPTSLDMAWEKESSNSSHGSQFGVDETRAMVEGVRSGQLPPETLEQHPVFRKIVKRCREMFGTSISMLTVMDEDRQIFLAESGLGGMREVTRDVTFCAHTILSGRKGFTILDTHKDWRFQNGPLVQKYGSRFYAGVPLMAPNMDGSDDSEAAACPIGTLCVVDDKPRDAFGIDERKKLVYMAEYARREIEKWFMKKMEQKIKALETSQELWLNQVKNVEVSEDSHESRAEVLTDTEQGDQEDGGKPGLLPVPAKKKKSFVGFRSSSSNVSSTPPTSPSSYGNMSLKSPGPVAGPSLFDDITAVVKPKMQKVFDLATKLVGDTLDLSLVYLVAVTPKGDSDELGKVIIISGYNIPLPVPILDPGLHLRALRAPEGGLLYQNPSLQEMKDQSLNALDSEAARDEEAGKSHLNDNAGPHCSAMLVSLGKEEDRKEGGGFVLAGFTSDRRRVFGGEDVAYMKQFAQELSKYTIRLKL